MYFFKIGATGAAIAVAAALPALAETPTTVADWSGFYIGAGISAPYGSADSREVGYDGASASGDWSGNLPVLRAGYDWQDGRLVYGLSLTASLGEITVETPTSEVYNCEGCALYVEDQLSLSARLGYAFDDTLVYVLAGKVRADITMYDDYIGVNFDRGFSTWTVGMGVEHKFTDHLSGMIEVSHTDFGRMNTYEYPGDIFYSDIAYTTAIVGVNYRW